MSRRLVGGRNDAVAFLISVSAWGMHGGGVGRTSLAPILRPVRLG